MHTLEYAGEIILYFGGLLAVFEFLPPARRASIDDYVNKRLTWSLLVTVASLAIALHLCLRYFAYVTPFAVLVALVIVFYVGRFLGLRSFEEPRVFWLFSGLSLAIIITVFVFTRDLALLLFCASLANMILAATFTGAFRDSDFAKGNAFFSVVFFVLVGFPSGLGYWGDPAGVATIMSPYVWVSNTIEHKSNWFCANIVIPRASAENFEAAFSQSSEMITNLVPGAVEVSPPFAWFSSSRAGYLFIFAVGVQILFLVYIWYSLRLLFVATAVPLIRLSNWLKERFGIQQRRIPIAGVLLVVGASTYMIVLKTIKYFIS